MHDAPTSSLPDLLAATAAGVLFGFVAAIATIVVGLWQLRRCVGLALRLVPANAAADAGDDAADDDALGEGPEDELCDCAEEGGRCEGACYPSGATDPADGAAHIRPTASAAGAVGMLPTELR